MSTTAPKTSAKRTIVATLGRNLICAALLLGSFAAVQAFGFVSMTYAAPTPHVAADAAPSKAHRLAAANDCDLPKGVIPGHAVVTVGGRTRLASGDLGFSIWLGVDGEPGTGDETAGVVHAFCQ